MKKEESKFIKSNIFEGMVSIRSLINAQDKAVSDRKITKVYVSESKTSKRGKELSYIKARSYDLGYTIEVIPDEELDSLTLGNSHGGLICEASERTIPQLTNETKLKENGFYVMIEGIEDPYNFGYALRSLYAAGADGIILSPRNWMSAAGVVCRASAGASEVTDIYICDGSNAVNIFRNKGYSVICSDIKNSVSVYETELKYPLFLIVGGEKRGITSALLSKADKIVRLDYKGEFNNALSAASAASILAFEIMRQNLK
ncbi:MAG: RNA methyltransferase [Ruminococcaceae bacterium]|nr:RNA methyltransferase [Oscillospiraceae bacterium]